MALTRRKRYANQTMRRARISPNARAQRPSGPNIVPTSLTHVASTLLVVFPVAMIWTGALPKWLNNAQTVIGVTITGPTSATLTFGGATAATATTIPFEDPAFRSESGAGFVQSGSYTTI